MGSIPGGGQKPVMILNSRGVLLIREMEKKLRMAEERERESGNKYIGERVGAT